MAKKERDAYDLQEAERKRRHRELAKDFVRFYKHYPPLEGVYPIEEQRMYDDAGNPLIEPVRESYLIRIPRRVGPKSGTLRLSEKGFKEAIATMRADFPGFDKYTLLQQAEMLKLHPRTYRKYRNQYNIK